MKFDLLNIVESSKSPLIQKIPLPLLVLFFNYMHLTLFYKVPLHSYVQNKNSIL